MKRIGMILLKDLLLCILLISLLLSIYTSAHFRIARLEAGAKASVAVRNEIVNKISRKKLLDEDSDDFCLKRVYYTDCGETIFIYEVKDYEIEFSYIAKEKVGQ